MKTGIFSTKRFFIIGTLALSSVFAMTACDKNDDNDAKVMFNLGGSATGTNVVPSVTTTGTGTISGTYNRNTNVMDYSIAWTGLSDSASAVTLYSGAVGTNGTLVQDVNITTIGMTGASTGSITLTDAQETDLLAGNWYYLIGTSNHTSGEVRGQITASPQ
jgi:CHRD domain-containing protein